MRRTDLVTLLCFLALAPCTLAQATQPQLQQRPAGQHASDLVVTQQMVVFNVTVHDKNGAPIRGLKPEDFSLTDDNVPQKVTFLEEHDATQPGQAVPLAPLPPGVYTNIPSAPVNDALNVILLDNQNTRIRDQSRLYSDLRKLVAELPPGARTAIFKSSTHLEIVCGFTADRERLKACLANDAAWPSVPVPTANIDQQTGIFGAVTEYLSQYPGRKNVLWIASDFPGNHARGANGNPQADFVDSFEADALTDVVLGDGSAQHPRLTTNDIAIYPIDPAALETVAAFKASSSSSNSLASLGNIADTGRALRITNMDIIAHETGGKAIYGNNDIAGQAIRAIVEGSSYYTIAWTPHNPRLGAFHHVDILLQHRSGVKADYRPGYRALPEATGQTYAQAHQLPAALAHGSPDANGLYFRARVLPTTVQPDLTDPSKRLGHFAGELKNPLRYAIDWAVDPRRLNTAPPAAGAPAPSATFTVVAYNADGSLLNYIADQESTVGTPPIEQGGLQYHQFIDLPEGNIYLRLDVTASTGSIGSTEIALKSSLPSVAPPAATPANASTPAAK